MSVTRLTRDVAKKKLLRKKTRSRQRRRRKFNAFVTSRRELLTDSLRLMLSARSVPSKRVSVLLVLRKLPKLRKEPVRPESWTLLERDNS